MDADVLSISLVDALGFESLDVNSFEQFCVNYTYERVHQLFIDHVFKQEVGVLQHLLSHCRVSVSVFPLCVALPRVPCPCRNW